MNPIYNEYIQYLKHKGLDIGLQEGYYWLDAMVIKFYDRKGIQQKLGRLYIDDKLNMTFKLYIKGEIQAETWAETINRNIDSLKALEKQSLGLIREIGEAYEDYEKLLLTSGGKDSGVLEHLVRQVYPDIRALFNNTTLDCADTYKYIKKVKNVEIISPEEGFYQWRKRINFVPSRFGRGCCNIYKEWATSNYLQKKGKYLLFMGMRNDESNGRSGYEDVWRNKKWNKKKWLGILPIRKWSEEQIWLYTMWKNIPINDKYKKGYARVGCSIACPFYTKTTWALDKFWYPKAYYRWQKILEEDFKTNYKWTRMNCTLEEYFTCWNGGIYRPQATEEVIKEFADYKGIDIEFARKYFNHTCKKCGKSVVGFEEIAMNLKLLGRNIEQYYCKQHLKEMLDMDRKQWSNLISEFKSQGCTLF